MTYIATARSVEEAVKAIDSYQGPSADFVLRIALAAIGAVSIDGHVITGLQMSAITDRALSKNWCPKGFTDEGEFRLYFYGDW
mgnify:CR=1 FL=1